MPIVYGFVALSALSLTALYLVLSAWIFCGGLRVLKLSTHQNTTEFHRPTISIVVAFRNEAHNLAKLIQDFRKLAYPPELMELILVNDHSTDSWQTILGQQPHERIHVCHLPEGVSGKKAALRFGASNSCSKYLAFTDADCQLPTHWLNYIAQSIHSHKAQLYIGAVVIESHTFLGHLQRAEMMQLSYSALSTALTSGILANGANLVCETTYFNALGALPTENIAGGDDMFLLEQVKRDKSASLSIIPFSQASVHTAALTNLGSLWKQRVRWSRKSKAYSDPAIMLSGAIVGGFFCIFVMPAGADLFDRFKGDGVTLFVPGNAVS